ncbi:MAG: MmgE/PrpD family protein [Candidatus Binatia bacterium]
MEATEKIARYVAGTEYEKLPATVVEAAKTAFIDCLGVTLAGSREDSATICAEIVREEKSVAEATIFGQGFQSSAAQAAFANGTAAHALDFDHSLYLGQPTSAVIPAVMSLAESLGARGRDVMEAYVAGFEATAKIAKSIPEEGRGAWHSAGTLGTLGATLSCAKLLRLDADKIRMALGIAASMASGVVCNYGTMTKPLDTALAARNGVVAAKLAHKGYTANPRALESETGFYGGFISLPPDLTWLEELGQSYDLTRGLKIKPYPCGGLAHNAIDAVLEMRALHGITADKVESIHVRVAKHAYSRLVFRVPQTGLQGKFCMGYVLARAIIDGKVSLDAFTDAAVRQREILELAEKVHMSLNPEFVESPTGARPCSVSVRLKDGQTFYRQVEHAKGGPEVPLSPAALREKFVDCAHRAIDKKSIQDALQSIERLENLEDIRSLCQLLRGSESK